MQLYGLQIVKIIFKVFDPTIVGIRSNSMKLCFIAFNFYNFDSTYDINKFLNVFDIF